MHMHARDNPFASHRVEALLFRSPGFSIDEQIARLEKMNWRGSILGPHGSGKTTLLLELHHILGQRSANRPAATLWFVPRDPQKRDQQWRERMATADEQQLLLVDGLERLRFAQRRRLAGLPWSSAAGRSRRMMPRGVVVTSHRPAGFQVWIQTGTTVLLMEELLLELFPAADESLISAARMLFARFSGNIREVFRGLYDRMASENSVIQGVP
jgi:energy-coupling factor transporter ATP-binding protein EcfA2